MLLSDNIINIYFLEYLKIFKNFTPMSFYPALMKQNRFSLALKQLTNMMEIKPIRFPNWIKKWAFIFLFENVFVLGSGIGGYNIRMKGLTDPLPKKFPSIEFANLSIKTAKDILNIKENYMSRFAEYEVNKKLKKMIENVGFFAERAFMLQYLYTHVFELDLPFPDTYDKQPADKAGRIAFLFRNVLKDAEEGQYSSELQGSFNLSNAFICQRMALLRYFKENIIILHQVIRSNVKILIQKIKKYNNKLNTKKIWVKSESLENKISVLKTLEEYLDKLYVIVGKIDSKTTKVQ